MYYEPGITECSLPRSPFKSCVVPRAIGWLSTLDANGVPNLAPYSQFTNLSFDPPLVMVSINQATDGTRKDTTRNIEETGEFVYNMVTYDLKDAMNVTAASFAPDEDEFEKAGLTKAPSVRVKPWRVKESPIQFECKYLQTVRIPGDSVVGAADLLIGKVVAIHIADEVIRPDGKIDIEKIRPLARMGYCDYTVIDKVFEIAPPTDAGYKEDFQYGLDGKAGVFQKLK